MKLEKFFQAPRLAWICLAVLLVAPLSFGKIFPFGKSASKNVGPRVQAQAQVLDHAEIPCDNCLFGVSHYYYCFAVDNKILIGDQATRVINFEDRSSNYLTKVRKNWLVWTPASQTIPITYDSQHIWVTRPNGKTVRLTEGAAGGIFTNNAQCKAADKAHGN